MRQQQLRLPLALETSVLTLHALAQATAPTLFAGVVEGSRALMPAQTRALSRHLDSVMPTVHFSAAARPLSPQ